MMTRVFGIAPASPAPFIFLGAVGLLLLFVIALLGFVGYSMRNAHFEVTDQGLSIKGSLYGRFIPRTDIVRDRVKIINLNTQTEFRPAWKSNGSDFPGYREGWFRLKNKEKALLVVTDYAKVVYLPTNQNYSVLLSVSNPEDFYNSIKLWK